MVCGNSPFNIIMDNIKWFIIVFSFFASVSAKPDDRILKCCQYGISKATASVMMGEEKFGCLLDDAMMNTIHQEVTLVNEFEKIICKTLFKQCCIGSAKSQFCVAGIGMGKTGLAVCTKGENEVGGTAQRECCDCCKLGEKAAEKAENCSQTVFENNELCTHAFRKCCDDLKEKLPKPTLKPAHPKTCADIKCDHSTTIFCTETKNGPQCICMDGFYSAQNNITCLDINECTNTSICSVGTCVNTEGSYKCMCVQGYKMQDGECVVDDTKECKKGYELKNGICVDTNECILGESSPCHASLKCLNLEGSFQCVERCTLNKGLKLVYSRGKAFCVDIDECAIHGNSVCANPYTECLNIVGGYQCKQVRCANGFDLVDGHCVDIDECKRDPDICGKYGQCQNLYGRHSCVCGRGYISDPITKKCIDEDECKLKKHRCSYQCRNTNGSYKCLCPPGYKAQDRNCLDIDECKTRQHTCKGNERCFNTYGSFRCIDESCPKPYYIRTGSKERPLGCRKNCFALTNKWNRAKCNKDKKSFISIKRVIFDFQRKLGFVGLYQTKHDKFTMAWMSANSPELRFRFYWTHSEIFYIVSTKLLHSGNEEGLFGLIHDKKKKEVFVVNKYEIQGPRQFHIVMVTEVRHAGVSTVVNKHEYNIFISVSEHQFFDSPSI